MERVKIVYKNLSEKFTKHNDDFNKQYCNIYKVRLNKMRQLLEHQITKKWGTEYPIYKLHKLSEECCKCIVIGTLFKDQKLKPSVLKQLAEANQLIPQPIITHFTDESDLLFIEDELQRYQLLGQLKGDNLVTGITCALLGTDVGKGKFMVEDYCFANYQTQIERPLLQNDLYIVFISGLNLIHIENTQLQVQLLINWLSGLIGDISNIKTSKLTRLIICGNSIRDEAVKIKLATSLTARTIESNETIEAVKLLDTFLLHLCQVINVDVMPGENDPSNHILPQKQMHHCLFSNSGLYKSLNQVSNPYECEIEGVRILGTSGQPIDDLKRFSEISESIDALESCLEWNHLAPTAPDTLGCFPFYEEDVFIIESCPHVFFAGNQDKFDTKISKGPDGQKVRLMCVPKFYKTFTACVLNLNNLDCIPIIFQ